jgi:hypothetical protein
MSLPLVILLMTILAVAVTAGFARVSEERQIVGDQQAQVDAFAVAQSGLERYAALRDSQPPAYDSVTIRIGTRDTAYVVLHEIQAPSGPNPGLYVVRSRGVSHAAPRYSVNTPPAQRTVAQYATWQGAVMDVDAAWTSIAGLRSIGNNGSMNGNDECSPAVVAGVAVPEKIAFPGALSGFSAPPWPVGAPGVDTLGYFPVDVAPEVHIDWDGIVNGGAVTPNYTLTGTSGWPVVFTNWPMIRVDGSVTVSGGQSGQGLLIVTGDLLFTTGFSWSGVILVGGRLLVNGTPVVRGAMVSGLDVKLGLPITESSSGAIGSDDFDLRYNSCFVDQALAPFAHLQLILNAWTDSWPEN